MLGVGRRVVGCWLRSGSMLSGCERQLIVMRRPWFFSSFFVFLIFVPVSRKNVPRSGFSVSWISLPFERVLFSLYGQPLCGQLCGLPFFWLAFLFFTFF
ncbi:MAG: hypothetical protein AABY11_01000 [archaeon]